MMLDSVVVDRSGADAALAVSTAWIAFVLVLPRLVNTLQTSAGGMDSGDAVRNGAN